MQRKRFVFAIAVVIALPMQQAQAQTSPQEYAKNQVQRSIAGYDGECPCPFSKDKSGNLCGDKSAYLRGTPDKSGFMPFCYTTDIYPLLGDQPKLDKAAHTPVKLPGQPI